MKYLAAILTLVATQFLTGCFQTAVGLKVKPDGSGTIDQVFSMSTEALAQAKAMQSGLGGKAEGKLPTEIDEPKLKEAAAKMGEGVTFVSVKKLALQGREGFVATYAFTDVTKLKISLNDALNENKGDAPASEKKDQPVTFSFTKGSPAELVIHTPSMKNDKPAGEEKAGSDAQNEQMVAMMAPMLKDMRMSFVVDVQGTIVKTNSETRQGSRVTIMDVEVGKLLSNPAIVKSMNKIKDPTSPEAKALLKNAPGVKMEFENPVRISFK